MSAGIPSLDVTRADALLCDADGNLFPSEAPAFEASASVTNRLLAEIGSSRRFDAVELRLQTTGLNFRTTAARLAADAGEPLEDAQLERWVVEEKRVVTEHLRAVLRPHPDVNTSLERLGGRFELAAVSSSALSRLDACFQATELAELFPRWRRFSAEDSLSQPTSKPDPAIYLHTLYAMGIAPQHAIAIEDSAPGARSAIAAGIVTIGNLMFVPPSERASRAAELTAEGVAAVVSSWSEVEEALAASGPEPAAALA